MLTSDDDIWGAMVQRVAAITGLQTIRSEQGGNRPALPYAVVNFLGTRPLRDHPRGIDWTPEREDEGPDDTAGFPPDVTVIPLIDTEWHFSIHAYDEGVATGLLRPLRSAFELSQIMEPVYPFLVVNDMSQVRRIPEVVNKKWEERAQCDIFLHGVTRDGFVIDTIDDTSINVERL